MPVRLGRLFAFACALGMLPGIAGAKIDPGCGGDATSVVAGRVTNVMGAAVPGVAIQLRQANKGDASIHRQTTTAPDGTYRICTGHDTYDVRADDLGDVYAIANKQITTFTDLASDVNFALEYKLIFQISPQAVSIGTPGASKPVDWTIRSTAPPATSMKLELDHLAATVTPAFVGPDGTGFNLWRYSAALAHPLAEAAYFATASGTQTDAFGRINRVTELGHDPYFVDNQAPVFGPAGPGSVNCGGSQVAGPFSPAATTNPWALIVVGVCDQYSNGGRSSLDPYSVALEVFDPNGNPVTGGGLTLNQLSIQYLPSSPWALGTYRFRYRVKDNAGNQATSGLYDLAVSRTGGSVPVLSGFVPGNLGEGSNLGVVVGSGFTTPTSRAVVAFLATDPDGQGDLSPGSLRVRIYGPDARTLLYDYDATLPPICSPTPAPPGNTGCFNQGTGRFEATGFSLFGRPPGLYVATASIEDHAGNATTRTWRWFQVATL